MTGACRRVGEQLGINADTLRGWVKQAQIDAGNVAAAHAVARANAAKLVSWAAFSFYDWRRGGRGGG